MKRFLSLLCVACLVMTMFVAIPTTASAESTTENGLSYKIKDGEVIITDCPEDVAEIKIPATIDECPVTAISDNAFKNCKKLTDINIPECVK